MPAGGRGSRARADLVGRPRTNGKLALLAAAGKHADRQEFVALTGPHDRLERLTMAPRSCNQPSAAPALASARSIFESSNSRSKAPRTPIVAGATSPKPGL